MDRNYCFRRIVLLAEQTTLSQQSRLSRSRGGGVRILSSSSSSHDDWWQSSPALSSCGPQSFGCSASASLRSSVLIHSKNCRQNHLPPHHSSSLALSCGPAGARRTFGFTAVAPLRSTVLIHSKNYQQGTHFSATTTIVGGIRTFAFHKLNPYNRRKKPRKKKKNKSKWNPFRGMKNPPKMPFYETKTPKDYPLGPNYKPPKPKTEADEVPPLLLTCTASPYAYFAKMDDNDDIDAKKIAASLYANPPETNPYYFTSIQNKDIEKAVHGRGGRPPPAVAFLGRSNVGKSSLINALMQRNLAKTSKHPGRTQQPYLYGMYDSSNVNTQKLLGVLVDLPGYGFAIGPDEAIDGWQISTQAFLLTNATSATTATQQHQANANASNASVVDLRRVFLLQDARLGTPQQMDTAIMSWFDDHTIPYTVTLTKADNDIPKSIKHMNLVAMRFLMQQHQEDEENNNNDVYQSPLLHVTSAKKKFGIDELLMTVESEFVDIVAEDDDDDEGDDYYGEDDSEYDDDDEEDEEEDYYDDDDDDAYAYDDDEEEEEDDDDNDNVKVENDKAKHR